MTTAYSRNASFATSLNAYTSPLSSSPGPSQGYSRGSGYGSTRSTKEDAVKTVKRLEDALSAWNEYRLSLAASAKAGKKFAGALKDLTRCMPGENVAGR